MVASGVGATTGDIGSTVQSGQVAQNAVENNFLSQEEYNRKVELLKKAGGSENSLNFKALAFLNKGSLTEQEAREFLALVAIDKYSNQLLKQYFKNPNSLTPQLKYDLAYLIIQASNGDPVKAQQIYDSGRYGTIDPYSGEDLNKAITKAKQSLSYANSTDKQLAEAAEPGLFGLAGKLGKILRYTGALAGSYNVGQGTEKIVNGKYSEGAVQVVNGTLMIAPVLTEAKYVIGRLEGAGAVKGANFAQSRIRGDQNFSEKGQEAYSRLAGYKINTIDDLALAIQKGKIKVSQLPVDYVELKSGQKLILNTRTSTALNRAGVSQDKWYGNNQTGIQVPGAEIGLTFDKLGQDQLKRNKLPETGSKTITRK